MLRGNFPLAVFGPVSLLHYRVHRQNRNATDHPKNIAALPDMEELYAHPNADEMVVLDKCMPDEMLGIRVY